MEHPLVQIVVVWTVLLSVMVVILTIVHRVCVWFVWPVFRLTPPFHDEAAIEQTAAMFGRVLLGRDLKEPGAEARLAHLDDRDARFRYHEAIARIILEEYVDALTTRGAFIRRSRPQPPIPPAITKPEPVLLPRPLPHAAPYPLATVPETP